MNLLQKLPSTKQSMRINKGNSSGGDHGIGSREKGAYPGKGREIGLRM